MGLLNTIKEPVFLKESSSAKKQLEALETLKQQASGRLLEQIQQEIKIVEAGIYGEEQIMFELKNCHMPIVVLHDLYFQKDSYTAQIDYMIVTRGKIIVLECKNLIGNIDIDSNGSFTRTFNYGKFYRKEGIYSPITQNQRHMELIKMIRMDSKKNIITKTLFEKNFASTYRSVVVLANPKTVLNAKYAPEEVKSQVIRADQLITFIKNANLENSSEKMSEKEMIHLAQFYNEHNVENPMDYNEKYRKQLETESESICEVVLPAKTVEINDNMAQKEQIICPRCGALMSKRTASKGKNAGKNFYGCTKYPKCYGTINIG